MKNKTLLVILLVAMTLLTKVAHAKTDHCSDGWVYKSEAPPFAYTAENGKNITMICIKSSTETFVYTSDTNDGCYQISGIGTQAASAVKIGEGRLCHDISYTAFYED
ncbi:MAG: hypothetical protein AAB875_06540, partial [Patescibacteria group bacterium]